MKPSTSHVDVHNSAANSGTEDSPKALESQSTDAVDPDPLAEYDPAVERRLRLKIDFCVIPTVALIYLFCFIDRANIGNARIAGLELDLDMAGYDYNILISVFYISYILFEIPSNILCKWIGPGWFLPAATVLFGIVSLCTAYVQTLGQASAVRFLLGIFEAGMLPGISYYLSRWYRRSELVFRISLYIVTAPLAGALGGLLASAILTLDNFAGLRQWRMIFVIEGIITITIGLIAFFTVTDRPATAWWLTESEKKLAIARVQSERLGTQVLDKIDTVKLKRGLTAPVTLSISFIFLLNNITTQGLAFFLPTIVRTVFTDRSTVQLQILTAPPYFFGAVCTLIFPLISWRLDKRQVLMIACAPFCMVGYIMFLGSNDASVRYGATFLVASCAFVFGALTNAQVSANVVSDTARSAAIGMNVMMGSIGGLVASWSFLPNDSPNYPIGNGLNLAANTTILVVSIATLVWMKQDNQARKGRDAEMELRGLTAMEIEDLDWKHPNFFWRP